MIQTSITRSSVVFLLPPRHTRSASNGSQVFDSHKWPTVLVRNVKEKKQALSRHNCVDHCILLLEHLSKHMHLKKKNGYKRFSKTNSTDPTQSVSLRQQQI